MNNDSSEYVCSARTHISNDIYGNRMSCDAQSMVLHSGAPPYVTQNKDMSSISRFYLFIRVHSSILFSVCVVRQEKHDKIEEEQSQERQRYENP